MKAADSDLATSSVLGFGASSSRVIDFSNDTPSPGLYYTKALRTSALLRSPSYSNRGAGVGFASQETHERSFSFNPPKATRFAGPYHIPDNMGSTRKTMSWPLFGEPAERIYYEESITRRDVPGPATYHPDTHYDSRGPKYNQHATNATYKSVTNRRSFYHAALQSSNSPGPANYSITMRPVSPCSAAWSFSHVPRLGDTGSPARFQSPGSVAHSPSHMARCRSAGANKGSKGKLFESPTTPVQHFGSEATKGANNPRSFVGNLMEKSELPGPGAYQLRPNTAGPSSLRGRSITGESSVFCSESQNHIVDVRKGPGPAYYSPKPSYDQKVITMSNMDGHWMV